MNERLNLKYYTHNLTGHTNTVTKWHEQKYEQLGILTEMSSLLEICRSTFIKHTARSQAW